MNEFEKWFNGESGPYNQDPYIGDNKNNQERFAQMGWNACKERVLEILKAHTHVYKKSIDDSSGIFEIEVTKISEAVTREIEKL